MLANGELGPNNKPDPPGEYSFRLLKVHLYSIVSYIVQTPQLSSLVLDLSF